MQEIIGMDMAMDMDPIVLTNNNKPQDIREMIATKKRKSIEII